MDHFEVCIETRSHMIGVASIVSVHDADRNDVTARLEEQARSRGIDLHGVHLFGQTEDELRAVVGELLARILGVEAGQLTIDVEFVSE
jgi:hypothetical protein